MMSIYSMDDPVGIPYDYDDPKFDSWTEIRLTRYGFEQLASAPRWDHNQFKSAEHFVLDLDRMYDSRFSWRIKVKEPVDAILIKLTYGGV